MVKEQKVSFKKKIERKKTAKIKKNYFFLILLFLFLIQQKEVVGQAADGGIHEMMEELDYTKIQKVLDEEVGENFQFGDYITDVISGKQSLSIKAIFSAITSSVTTQMQENISIFRKLLAVALLSALFTNFSYTFRNTQVAETGFFVTYLLMFGILAAAYMTGAQVAGNVIRKLLEFMKVLVPVYSMSVAFSTGVSTSAVLYQMVLVLITLVDVVLLKIVLPMIHLFMMAMLANHISEDEMLSKFANLLATIVQWILKSLLAVVIGIGAIQSMLAPALDHVKNTSIMKWLSAIPGVGGILGGVTETVLGAGTLLRNAIGVAGVIAILILCFIPVIKLLVNTFLYKFGGAVIQPIADKRVLACIESCSNASGLLLKTVFTGIVLFLISIVITAI